MPELTDRSISQGVDQPQQQGNKASSHPGLVHLVQRLRGVRIERYGTLLFFLVVYVVIGIMRGSTYISGSNILLVLGQNSYEAFAAAAVSLTLVAGQFDLSVGSMVGLSAVLVAGFTANQHIPTGAAVPLVLLIGALLGLFNALLVTRAKVNAFIATLGTGSIFYGIAIWYSGGNLIFAGIPSSLTAPATNSVASVPLPLIYAAVLLLVGWAVTRQTIVGRRWYAIGANTEAARLVGIRIRRLTVFAFVGTSAIAALGGIILTARFGSADPTTGPDLLLPAFAAAFLGASIVADGRFSLVGAVLATFLIAFATNGLEQLGLSPGLQNIFDGAVLIGAVALTEELRRRHGLRSVVKA